MDLPIGTIILWDSGQIPAGWIICDGDNGTIETRGRFIRGSTSDATIGTAGGTLIHSHTNGNTSTRAAHNHGGSYSGSVGSGSDVLVTQGSGNTSASTNHSHDVTINISNAGEHAHTTPNTDSASNTPKHIKRIFIMRVS